MTRTTLHGYAGNIKYILLVCVRMNLLHILSTFIKMMTRPLPLPGCNTFYIPQDGALVQLSQPAFTTKSYTQPTPCLNCLKHLFTFALLFTVFP